MIARPSIKTITASLITTLTAVCLSAQAGNTKQVISASVGSASPDEQQLNVSDGGTDSSFALDNSSGGIYSVAWGLQDEKARFRFEYYYSSLDTAYNGSPGTIDSQALYYSGYWTPSVFNKFKAIAGAGVGYGEQKLKHFSDGVENERFSGDGWVYKFTLGGEYKIAPRLGVYLTYELAHQHDFDDSYEYGAETSPTRVKRELEKSKTSMFNVGVNFSF